MINNVLIVGLGGVGSVYASKIKNAKILVDESRFKRYIDIPTEINGQEYRFEYITAQDSFNADLIIITTKFYNLVEVLDSIKNFVTKNTIIISLLNGISSEGIISKRYPESNVIPSYLICNSIIRFGRKITHDNVNKIVIAKNTDLEHFFSLHNINYEVSEDIKSDLWQKFMLNIIANQLSAVTRKTFGEMNSSPKFHTLLPKILEEVILIAQAEGVKNPEMLAQKAITTFKNMASYGKTSMLQDIENNKKTEIDAFAGTIIKLGEKHNIPTPYNNLFYFLLS